MIAKKNLMLEKENSWQTASNKGLRKKTFKK